MNKLPTEAPAANITEKILVFLLRLSICCASCSFSTYRGNSNSIITSAIFTRLSFKAENSPNFNTCTMILSFLYLEIMCGCSNFRPILISLIVSVCRMRQLKLQGFSDSSFLSLRCGSCKPLITGLGASKPLAIRLAQLTTRVTLK